MRILVTGANGLVGGPLVRKLRAAGHDVKALDVAGDGDRLDVRDAKACRKTVGDFGPDVVMHLAAWTDVDGAERDFRGAFEVNTQGAYNVAQACPRGAAMLYVSTDYVFDGLKGSPYVEADLPNPLSAYGATKLQGEAAVRATVDRWWIVRCQSIYGEGRKSFPDAILARAKSGGALTVVADQRVQPSWCEDVAEALVATLRAPPGLYLAANAGSCTWRECAQATVRLDGMSAEVAAKTAAQHAAERTAMFQLTATRPASSVFDCSKLENATRIRLRPWDEALAAYLDSRRSR